MPQVDITLSATSTTVGQPITITFDATNAENGGGCYTVTMFEVLTADAWFNVASIQMDDLTASPHCGDIVQQVIWTPQSAGTFVFDFSNDGGQDMNYTNGTEVTVTTFNPKTAGGFMTFFE